MSLIVVYFPYVIVLLFCAEFEIISWRKEITGVAFLFLDFLHL